MATYIILGNFTEQGVNRAKDTVKRAEAFRDMAKKAGAAVKEQFWLLGQYDMMSIVEAPDDATMTALCLSAASLGNVTTQTLRAFTPAEMGGVLGKMA